MLFQQANTFPTFTEETVKAINEATQGKLDALWEAENLITVAILADKSLDPMVKAQEVQRSMARYIATVGQYSSVTTVMPGMGMMPGMMPVNGMQGYAPYGGYQPPMYQATNQTMPMPPINHEHEFMHEGVVYTLTIQIVNNKLENIYLSKDNESGFVRLEVVGVFNNEEDRDAVAIAIRGDWGAFDIKDVAKELYIALSNILGMSNEDHLYSYTVRMSDESDVLYIDMVDGCDSMEIESFSDNIKGHLQRFVTYEQLFPESAGE